MKYKRTLHSLLSEGTTSDDRFMPNDYLKRFINKDLIITEKLDGQNNCFKSQGVYARSYAVVTEHPWDKPIRERWELIKDDLGNLEIYGENMYGVHSIEYSKLESFFYVFGIKEGDKWLSWDEVKFYSSMFDFPTVPEIPIISRLEIDTEEALYQWLIDHLGCSWKAFTGTSGNLGGIDTKTGESASEGFVIRYKDGWGDNGTNEFLNIFKLVRSSHINTDVHWTKSWKPCELQDYDKYKWESYSWMKNIQNET